MPRPKPLVSLHGSVDFDKLVPFDSAPNSPPLAANDILVMRKAAGGDNLTLSIGDITATGSVNIANLIGGNNNDMLFKRAGVWIGSGPEGLSYDGFNMILTDDNLNFQGTGQLFSAGAGNWTQSSTGNIVQSGSGNIEISGTGHLIMSNAAAQVRAAFGIAALPGLTFDGDNDTGFYRSAGNRVAVSVGGVGHWEYNGLSYEGMAAGAPSLIDADSTGVIPNVLPNRSDANTGIGSSGLDELSLIAGGVEGIRIDEQAGTITVLPFGQIEQIVGSAGAPSYSFSGDDDTGFFHSAANQIDAALGGSRSWEFLSTRFASAFSNGPALINAAAGIAAVNIQVDKSTPGTGLSIGSTVMGLVSNGTLIASVDGPNGALVLNGSVGLTTTGGGGSGPVVKNEGATATNPVFCCNQADPDTGLTRSGVNQSSIVNGGVEAFRLRATTAFIAGNTNMFLWDYDNGQLEIVSVGAADSGGVGFKLLRIAN